MIIVTSTLNGVPNDVIVSELGLSRTNVSKQYALTSRMTSTYRAEVSPTKARLTLSFPESVRKDIAVAASAAGPIKLARAVNTITREILARNADLRRCVELVLDSAFKLSGTRIDYSEVAVTASGHSDILGLAVELYLRSNRTRRDRYNDIIFGGVMVRENYSLYSKEYGIVINGTGVVPDLDFDHPIGKYMDAAVGIGQRHEALWTDTCNWLGIAPRDIGDFRYVAGRFPWWLWAIWMDADLIRIANRRSWLKALKPVPANPQVSELYYPYYLLGQPALWHAKFERLKNSSYFAVFDTIAKKERDMSTLSKDEVFLKGKLPVIGAFLFKDVRSSDLLHALISGASLYLASSDIKQPTRPVSLFAPKLASSIVSQIFNSQLVHGPFDTRVRARNTVAFHDNERTVVPAFVKFQF